MIPFEPETTIMYILYIYIILYHHLLDDIQSCFTLSKVHIEVAILLVENSAKTLPSITLGLLCNIRILNAGTIKEKDSIITTLFSKKI